MATKKNKQKAKKPFWEMDFLKHYLPTVVKARIAVRTVLEFVWTVFLVLQTHDCGRR